MLPKNVLNYPYAICHTWHTGSALSLCCVGQVRTMLCGVCLSEMSLGGKNIYIYTYIHKNLLHVDTIVQRL